MIKKMKWRYYCEFCGRGGASAPHISRHEKSCTNNPNRVCKLCQEYGDGSPQASMEDMQKALSVIIIKKGTEFCGDSYIIENQQEALSKLRDVTNYCPACMLAAIRSLGCPAGAFDEFNYRKEKEEWWNHYNEIQRDRGYY